MADSTQHKIGRNRAPRVQITYDVEIGNAIEKVEIPFVVGIMADLSAVGDGERHDGVPLKDKARSFVEIDRDNFTDVMAKLSPGLVVDGALDEHGNADADGVLTFKSMGDFDPASLVKRIKGLKDLNTQRSALRDILTKLDSNDELHKKLKASVEKDSIKAIGEDAAKQIEKLEPAPAAT